MAPEARTSSRIHRDLKAQRDAVLAKLEIKPSQIIIMFYTQITRHPSLPLELKFPNDETTEVL